MKKVLLAVLVGGLGVSAAQAAPTVYGKLNVAATETDVYSSKTNSAGTYAYGSSKNVATVDSYASRLGVKGEEKLTDKLSAIYQVEWQLSVSGSGDTLNKDGSAGKQTDWTQRNRFLGLKYDGIGAVKVGKFDTYLKQYNSSVDYFDPMGYLYDGNWSTGGNRPNNVIGFESDPRALHGFAANLMLVQAENTKPEADNSQKVKRNFGSASSGSVTYSNKDIGLFTVLAFDQNMVSKFAAANGTKGASAEAQSVRAIATLDTAKLTSALQGLQLNLLLQTTKPTDLSDSAKKGAFLNLDRESAFIVSSKLPIAGTPWAIKGQYGQATTTFNGNQSDITLRTYGAMLDYNFNSRARAYGFFARQANNYKDSKTGLKTPTLNMGGVGLEYNF